MIAHNEWEVRISKKVEKQISNLSVDIRKRVLALLKMLTSGPIQKQLSNFGLLRNQKSIYHGHLKKGHPTYIACWYVNKEERIIEVFYVGTHENAPY